MPADFTCCECGAPVSDFTRDKPPEPPLCAICVWVPGWTAYPELLAIFGRRQHEPPKEER
jgi:hypothetical protein